MRAWTPHPADPIDDVADVDLLSQILGPLGALVLAVSGLGVAVRQHLKDDAQKDRRYDESIAFERGRTKDSEDRLLSVGATMKDGLNVLERSVDLNERLLDERK